MNIIDFPVTRAEREMVSKLKAELHGGEYTHVLLEDLTLEELMTALNSTGIYLRKTEFDVAPVLFKLKGTTAA